MKKIIAGMILLACVRPAFATPRYLIQDNVSILSIKDLGAKGDGTDQTAYFTKALSTTTYPNVALVIPAGTYLTTKPIVLTAGQSLWFIGTPTIKFSLSGSSSGFIVGSANDFSEDLIHGSAVIDMQNTGGTVFTLGGLGGYTFGPSEGNLRVYNEVGNVLDIGPTNNLQSLENVTVQNIDVMTNNTGKLINILLANYTGTKNSAPYILGLTIRHVSNNDSTSIGQPVTINANVSGPEVNMNGISFENDIINSSGTTIPIYIQSDLLSGSGNSISFSMRDCSFLGIGGGGSPPWLITVDSAITAGAVWGIDATNVSAFVADGPNIFSPNLVLQVPAYAHLTNNGNAYPYDNRRSVNNLTLGTGNTSNGIDYTNMTAPTGGGSGSFELHTYSTGTVTTGALQVGVCPNYGCIVIVSGYDAGGDNFSDLLYDIYNQNPTVITSKTAGSPAARTYTTVNNALKLSMASGSYKVTTSSLVNNEY